MPPEALSRLDALLNLVGELVIDRTRLVQLGNNVAERFGAARHIAPQLEDCAIAKRRA